MPSHGIIFYGTPDFAVPSLRALIEAGYPLLAVVTAPDKPSGRGLSLKPSSVKLCALEYNIPVLQPENLKAPSFIDQLKEFNPALQVVIAFRMLPQVVWSLPPLGTFNLHASLLPQYRGAAPINRAIMNGETVTGLTTFFINEHIDTGRIILQQTVAIGKDDTAGDLHDRMMITGAGLVCRTAEMIFEGTVTETEQVILMGENSVLKTAPKLFREDSLINWDQEISRIHNHVRGLSPYPGAYTIFSDQAGNTYELKILSGFPEPADHNLSPGEFFRSGKDSLSVASKDGFYALRQVQLQGRKTMEISEFLRGYGRYFSERC